LFSIALELLARASWGLSSRLAKRRLEIPGHEYSISARDAVDNPGNWRMQERDHFIATFAFRFSSSQHFLARGFRKDEQLSGLDWPQWMMGEVSSKS
jgi:hypothetical protein